MSTTGASVSGVGIVFLLIVKRLSYLDLGDCQILLVCGRLLCVILTF